MFPSPDGSRIRPENDRSSAGRNNLQFAKFVAFLRKFGWEQTTFLPDFRKISAKRGFIAVFIWDGLEILPLDPGHTLNTQANISDPISMKTHARLIRRAILSAMVPPFLSSLTAAPA